MSTAFRALQLLLALLLVLTLACGAAPEAEDASPASDQETGEDDGLLQDGFESGDAAEWDGQSEEDDEDNEDEGSDG